MEKLTKPFLLISKPYGITSRKFLDAISVPLLKPKIGHTGTLDPIATGLLVVAIGNGTRLIPYLDLDTKEYFIKIKLGIQTDTDDVTGKVIEVSEKIVSIDEIKHSLEKFQGEIEQYPPIYSAKKIQGKEIYKYARECKEIPEIKPSKVNIFGIELVSFGGRDIVLRVNCSKGTYMRSIARDLGKDLGTFGTISAIARTKVGKFTINEATTLREISKGNLEKGFLSEEEAISLPTLVIADTKSFETGISIKENFFLVKSDEGNFLGIAELKNGEIHPEVVINENH